MRSPHPSILVEGDAGFLDPLSGVRSGSGAVDDPYRITSWTIVHTQPYGIRLEGTRAHVVIEDVAVVDATIGTVASVANALGLDDTTGQRGIDLRDAENVTIRSVSVALGTYGIRIRDSRNVTVDGARVGEPTPDVRLGVAIEGSQGVRVRGLVARTSDFPLWIFDSTDVLVADSNMSSTGFASLPIARSSHVTIARSAFHAIEVIASVHFHNLSFVDNTFFGGSNAISIEPDWGEAAHGVFICGNTIRATTSFGGAINARYVRGLDLRHNTFEGNHLAMRSSTTTTFEGNRVTDSRTWGFLYSGRAMEAHGNVFERNGYGVGLYGAANATANWWGAANGPSGVGTGSGDAVATENLASVQIAPWLTSPPAAGAPCMASTSPGK